MARPRARRSREPRRGSVRVRAFAKINLTLRVLGIRADGYHELRTAFQSLAVHDTLTCTATDGPFAIECDAPEVPCDSTNLVWRAAAALWRSSGRRGKTLPGVRIRLEKRIPMQAGLGGGSSDAAAALRGLAALWRLEPSAEQLHAIARAIGADVPYFLVGGTALGVDRGDLLFPLEDQAPAWVVLALPDFGVSTREAYGWWDADCAGKTPVLPIGALSHGLPAGDWVNDLEPPVIARRPEIGRLTAKLRRLGARHAAMSGSGSAVFGLFDGEPAARRAARTMSSPSTAVYVTATLTRRRFAAASLAKPASR